MWCIPYGSPKNIYARGRTHRDLWHDRETHVVARLKNGISEEHPKNVFIYQIKSGEAGLSPISIIKKEKENKPVFNWLDLI